MKQPQPDTTLSGGTKSYIANIKQSSTDPPSAIEFVNTINAIWGRTGAGNYYLEKTDAFPHDKTFINGFSNFDGSGYTAIPIIDGAAITGYYALSRGNANQIILETFDPSFSRVEFNSIMGSSNLGIQITVYS